MGGCSRSRSLQRRGSNYLMVKSTYSRPIIQIQATTSPTGSITSTSTVSSSACRSSAASSTSNSSASGGFGLAISPSLGTVVQGAGISTQIYVTSSGTAGGVVSLFVSNPIPGTNTPIPGASITIVPPSGIPSYSSNMRIATSSSTPPGTYCIQVTGTESQAIKTSVFVLVVAPLNQNDSYGPMPNYTVVLIVTVVGVSLVAVVATGTLRRVNLRRRPS